MSSVSGTRIYGNGFSCASEKTEQNIQAPADKLSEIGKQVSSKEIEGASSENSSVPTRLSSLYKIPTTFVNNTISTIYDLFPFAEFLRTGSIENSGDEFLNRAYHVAAEPFLHFVKFINPNAKIEIKEIQFYSFAKWSIGKIVNCRESENFFKKHVVSRLAVGVFAVAAIVINTAQGIFGVIAGALAVVNLGKSERLNQLATWGLQVNLVTDLILLGVATYNPSFFSHVDIS